MFTCTIRVECDVAKRLAEFIGPCSNLHGYHIAIEATFTSKKRGKSGEVIDYYKLKELLGNWINKNWDHNTLLNKKDKKLGDAISNITGQKVFYFDGDPSAENIGEYVLKEVCPRLFSKLGVTCINVRVYDNPGAFVEAMG